MPQTLPHLTDIPLADILLYMGHRDIEGKEIEVADLVIDVARWFGCEHTIELPASELFIKMPYIEEVEGREYYHQVTLQPVATEIRGFKRLTTDGILSVMVYELEGGGQC